MSRSVVASKRVTATLALACSLALSAGTATATAASSPFDLLFSGSAGGGSTGSVDTAVVQEIVSATNAERRARGLRPLAVDSALTGIAQGWSNVMATTGNLRHNPSYTRDMRPGWTWAAENIINGRPPESGTDLVRRWMNSPGHRANILNPDFTHIGVGYATSGSDGRHYATQNFGAY
ncbi:CAP domain-containing protein [Rhodococcus spongiicola]|uniref:CAP domain-containing protein n=1 Tax=Rhodococcus spongiicola TaxID=2487352 RepID=A0A438AV16_9NOCA|nr:CAP domain-containing protein [Rhodococcus spongiicola]RVW02537.1 CAP domain-containing protein [Rhodococcus spongiicola]